MNRQDAKWMLLAPAIAAIVMLLGEPLRAEVLEHTTKVAGTAVHYKTVLLDGYDPIEPSRLCAIMSANADDRNAVNSARVISPDAIANSR
jgi:hypothetical protein